MHYVNIRSNGSNDFTCSTATGGAITAAVAGPTVACNLVSSGVISTYTGGVLSTAGSGAAWGAGVGMGVGGIAGTVYGLHGQDKEEV